VLESIKQVMGAIRKTDYKSAITSRPLRGACLKPPALLVVADLTGKVPAEQWTGGRAGTVKTQER
jgi:hypothetical protein